MGKTFSEVKIVLTQLSLIFTHLCHTIKLTRHLEQQEDMSNNQREKTENSKHIDNTDAEINRHFERGTKHAQEKTAEARASFHKYSKSL